MYSDLEPKEHILEEICSPQPVQQEIVIPKSMIFFPLIEGRPINPFKKTASQEEKKQKKMKFEE
jgi:hypothetical protein